MRACIGQHILVQRNQQQQQKNSDHVCEKTQTHEHRFDTHTAIWKSNVRCLEFRINTLLPTLSLSLAARPHSRYIGRIVALTDSMVPIGWIRKTRRWQRSVRTFSTLFCGIRRSGSVRWCWLCSQSSKISHNSLALVWVCVEQWHMQADRQWAHTVWTMYEAFLLNACTTFSWTVERNHLIKINLISGSSHRVILGDSLLTPFAHTDHFRKLIFYLPQETKRKS